MLIELFHDFVVAQLGMQMPDKKTEIQGLQSDDDILESGLIDSFAFIELCLAIEARTGAVVDIGALEPQQFSSIAALYELVTASSADLQRRGKAA